MSKNFSIGIRLNIENSEIGFMGQDGFIDDNPFSEVEPMLFENLKEAEEFVKKNIKKDNVMAAIYPAHGGAQSTENFLAMTIAQGIKDVIIWESKSPAECEEALVLGPA